VSDAGGPDSRPPDQRPAAGQWDRAVLLTVTVLGVIGSVVTILAAPLRIVLVTVGLTCVTGGLYGLLRLRNSNLGIQALALACLMALGGGVSATGLALAADPSVTTGMSPEAPSPSPSSTSQDPSPTLSASPTAVVTTPSETPVSPSLKPTDGYAVLYPPTRISVPALGCAGYAELDLDVPQVSSTVRLEGSDVKSHTCSDPDRLEFTDVEGLHVGDRSANLTPAYCIEMMALEPSVKQVSEPRAGNSFCVETAEGTVAVLEITEVQDDDALAAQVTAWTVNE